MSLVACGHQLFPVVEGYNFMSKFRNSVFQILVVFFGIGELEFKVVILYVEVKLKKKTKLVIQTKKNIKHKHTFVWH